MDCRRRTPGALVLACRGLVEAVGTRVPGAAGRDASAWAFPGRSVFGRSAVGTAWRGQDVALGGVPRSPSVRGCVCATFCRLCVSSVKDMRGNLFVPSSSGVPGVTGPSCGNKCFQSLSLRGVTLAWEFGAPGFEAGIGCGGKGPLVPRPLRPYPHPFPLGGTGTLRP